MNTSDADLQLQDLIADLQHSRRTDDLGRLALLTYCEVRRWGRSTGHQEIADFATRMVTEAPQPSRQSFLSQVDVLIATLQRWADR